MYYPVFLSYQGSLRINGVELRDLSPESWRQHLSWVGQNPQLPAATLRENVLLARPDASEQELYAALDAAWVSEFLPLLPQGVDTPLGNHASRLSVGQAQRVAVARALLNPCQLLLLDEPAASLDAHSEQRVMQALKAASKRQTTLMVTHQLEDLADWGRYLGYARWRDCSNKAVMLNSAPPTALLRRYWLTVRRIFKCARYSLI
ncbi:cysteine/glutathione ABC transporter membrane /ATP-binding component [Salmonella enterica subsp. enterica]|uniref:Cysteine/glutathione ABC transporter membrane /ATP-binding component n=1 Tax=Salmonella enterica I TaxID=59201 RepID=A0A3S4JGS5_SALET|nr:cysteine/glutathione ABC transporter membrane /ATP-binding component [Salmonella enterica subsp. enterica]